MAWIADFLWQILMLLALLILATAFFSPFEALGWRAGWTQQTIAPKRRDLAGAVAPPKRASIFLVYLTGVLCFEGGSGGRRETALLNAIAARLPEDAVLVTDVFPYSVSNNPLNGERLFAAAWRFVDAQRRRFKSPVNLYSAIIVMRNIFQVAVSADPRYGPLNNVGVAREIATSLLRHGYPAGAGQPVYIVGYSGGGQIAVGAARYLNIALNAPIRIVSLGGFFSDDPGVAYVDRIVDLQGTKDPISLVGTISFPGRWPFFRHTKWNRARTAGRIRSVKSGPMTHFGRTDYFSRSTTFPDGQSYAERTAELAAASIAEFEAQQASGTDARQ